MTRQPMVHQHPPYRPEDYGLEGPPPSALAPPGATRAFLIGMHERCPMPALQSMRVLVVLPGQRAHASAPHLRIALTAPPDVAAHALRPIAGEVLRDAQGRLFERRADRTVQSLRGVVAGARGELYEPTEEPEDTERVDADTPPPEEAAARPRQATPATVRALLPGPGKWVQVRIGEFATLLQGQLAHPDRLAPDYELGVWLQVFEARAELEPAQAARLLFSDERMASRLGPWSAPLAQRFGLALGPYPAGRAPSHAAPGRIGAGRRFFSLAVASDPTAQPTPEPSPREPAPAARTTVPPALQAAIPPCLPREQALTALQHAHAPGWWGRWRRRISPSARASWQQQLAGRSLDEQLWAVPPPPHGLGDARLRDWVLRTLRLAGYDAGRMADEWEIFWRCRGAQD